MQYEEYNNHYFLKKNLQENITAKQKLCEHYCTVILGKKRQINSSKNLGFQKYI